MEAGWVPKKLGMFCLDMVIYIKRVWVFSDLYFYDWYNLLSSFLLSDVYIDVPDIIDISHMRSKGHQPGEELLPDGGMWEVLC